MSKKNVKEKDKPQVASAIAGDLKKRLDWISQQQKNVDNDIEVLEKRHKKYSEGLPKVEAELKKLKAKKKELAERREKELKVVQELSEAFLSKPVEAEK